MANQPPKNGNRAAIRTLPRLNRRGDGLRKHRLNPQSLRKVVVDEEIEKLRTADGRRKADPTMLKPTPKVKKNGLINLKAFGDPSSHDEKLHHLQTKIADLNEEMVAKGRKSRDLILEEKIFIIEHHFSKNWGPQKIAKAIGRSVSTVGRFLDKYRSTTTMARLHIEAQAENLAKRVTAKANVEEAMEVLDRIDALPKKERKTDVGPQFNIIVGTPGPQGGRGTIPVPSQKQIEAARGDDE